MKFKTNYLKKIYTRIPESDIHLITGTPIVIRIDKERYEKYGYESIYDNFTYGEMSNLSTYSLNNCRSNY
jgi:hypothetical protein